MKKFLFSLVIFIFLGLNSLFASPCDEREEGYIGYESLSCKGEYSGYVSMGVLHYFNDFIFAGGGFGYGKGESILASMYINSGITFNIWKIYISPIFDLNLFGCDLPDLSVGAGCLASYNFGDEDFNFGLKIGYGLSYCFESEYQKRFLNHYYFLLTLGGNFF